MTAAIINSGDVPAEPVITISKSATADTAAKVLTLTMEAEGTKTEIVLNYSISAGETVTVDIPNRKITSSVSGNIICKLGLRSVLSDFVVPPGFGLMSVDTVDTALSISCSFENQYLEASHDE